jgi:hypothetical protein
VFSFSKNLFFKDFQKKKMIVSSDGGGARIHSVLGVDGQLLFLIGFRGGAGGPRRQGHGRRWGWYNVSAPPPRCHACLILHAIFRTCIIFVA